MEFINRVRHESFNVVIADIYWGSNGIERTMELVVRGGNYRGILMRYLRRL